MAILAPSTDTGTLEFRTNAAQMKALVADLQERRAEAAMGGPARARERHAGRGIRHHTDHLGGEAEGIARRQYRANLRAETDRRINAIERGRGPTLTDFTTFFATTSTTKMAPSPSDVT